MLNIKNILEKIGIMALMFVGIILVILLGVFPFYPKTLQGWILLFSIGIPVVVLFALTQPLFDKYMEYINKKIPAGWQFSILRIIAILIPILILFSIMFLVIFYVANYFNIDLNSIK